MFQDNIFRELIVDNFAGGACSPKLGAIEDWWI